MMELWTRLGTFIQTRFTPLRVDTGHAFEYFNAYWGEFQVRRLHHPPNHVFDEIDEHRSNRSYMAHSPL